MSPPSSLTSAAPSSSAASWAETKGVGSSIAPLITALGVSFVLENSVLLLFGGFTKSYSTESFISPTAGIHIDGAVIDPVQITIFVVSILMMYGLMRIVNRTTLGKSMRAVASEPARAGAAAR